MIDRIRRLALALVLGLGGIALLNPHGPALYLHSWQLSQNPNIHFMEEWKPLPLQSLAGGDFWASVLLLLALVWWSPCRFSPTQVLLLLTFGLQTLAHARVLVWWIMVFAWVAVPHMQAVYERYFAATVRPAGRPSLRNTILAGLMCGVLLLWSAPAQWALWAEAPVGSKRVTALTPLKVADYLAKRYAEDPALGRCVFTSETQGEYLLWALRLTPPVRIFCYTHVHLLTPEHWQECMIVKNGDRGWQAVLDRHAVQFVVVEADQHRNLVAQVRAAPERWQIISNGAIFVAERRSSRPASGTTRISTRRTDTAPLARQRFQSLTVLPYTVNLWKHPAKVTSPGQTEKSPVRKNCARHKMFHYIDLRFVSLTRAPFAPNRHTFCYNNSEPGYKSWREL